MFRRFTTTKEKKKDKEGRQFRYEKVKKQNKGDGVAKMQQVNEEGEREKKQPQPQEEKETIIGAKVSGEEMKEESRESETKEAAKMSREEKKEEEKNEVVEEESEKKKATEVRLEEIGIRDTKVDEAASPSYSNSEQLDSNTCETHEKSTEKHDEHLTPNNTKNCEEADTKIVDSKSSFATDSSSPQSEGEKCREGEKKHDGKNENKRYA